MSGGLLAVAILLTGSRAFATETDQYYSLNREIRDSLEVLNEKVNRDILGALAMVNRRGAWHRYSCDYVAGKIYERFRIAGLHKIEIWAEDTPLIERVPSTPEEQERYYDRHDLYRNERFWDWGLSFGVKATFQLAGVRTGADKLSHFFQQGWRYYMRYRDFVRAGKTSHEAMEEVIRYGVRREKTNLGLATSGVFSFADLEANFQGFRFYESLCRDEMPRIQKTPGGWKLNAAFDWRDYVNPDFDESFNNSGYTPSRWTEVRKVLRSDYCGVYREPGARAIWQRYAREYPARSFGARYVQKLVESGEVPDQDQFSLDAACGVTEPAARPSLREGHRGSDVRDEGGSGADGGEPDGDARSEHPVSDYEAPAFDGPVYRPMIELGAGGVAGATSNLNVLLRVRFQVKETLVPADPKYRIQMPEYLIWARISGDLAVIPGETNDLGLPGGVFDQVGLPYMDIRFVPVERRFAVIDRIHDDELQVGLMFMPSRFRRIMEIDRNFDVEVGVVGIEAEAGFRHSEHVSLFASIALDALGYKAAGHASELSDFHGLHIATAEGSAGVDFSFSEGFGVRVIFGGVAGISFGHSGQAGFSSQSDLKAYAEVQADITRFIQLFARGQIDAAWNGAHEEFRSVPTLLFGAAFVY